MLNLLMSIVHNFYETRNPWKTKIIYPPEEFVAGASLAYHCEEKKRIHVGSTPPGQAACSWRQEFGSGSCWRPQPAASCTPLLLVSLQAGSPCISSHLSACNVQNRSPLLVWNEPVQLLKRKKIILENCNNSYSPQKCFNCGFKCKTQTPQKIWQSI